MIIFDLACAKAHRFEGWFASRSEFDRQRGSALISCPTCNSTDVRLVPSAVHLASAVRQAPKAADLPQPPMQQPLAVLRQLVDALVSTAEDVGPRFAAEARRIHYEEAPARSIRGQSTPEERDALRDEGIEFMQLPVFAKEDLS